jgi:membrane associated rhomboid family serine protease
MFDNIFQKFKLQNIVGKFIYANVAVYIIVVLIGVFSVLFNVGDGNAVIKYVELPSSLPLLLHRPWTLLTYMFLHEQFTHILWNMIALYVFGRIFIDFYSLRHFVGTYIMGGLFGGIAFVLSYNLFPYFAPYVGSSYLIGASASVLAIVVASAVRNPDYRINLLLIGSVKLSTFAIITVAISVLMLSGNNAGGNFAHLGGALAGWLVAYMLNKGVDITSVVNKPIDWIATLFKKETYRRKPKPKFKYSAGGSRNADYEYNARKKASEAEVDRILEKIKKGGYASLTDDEKKRLFDASSK